MKMRAYRVREYAKGLDAATRRLLGDDVLDTCIATMAVRAGGIDEGKRVVTAVITDPSEDSYGESIAVGAFDASLKAYMRNPVVLPCHAHWVEGGRPPVIARTLQIRQQDDALVAEIQFADFGLGLEYWPAYRDGYMSAFSVGFRAMKMANVNGVPTYTEAGLKEISACAVPANGNALVMAYLRSAAGWNTASGEEAGRSDVGRLAEDIEELRAKLDELRGIGTQSPGLRMDQVHSDIDATRAMLQTI